MKNHLQQHISDRIQQSLGLLENQQLAQDLWHILAEQHFQGFLPQFVVNHLCEKYQLSTKDFALLLLPISASYANPTISHFSVGSVVTGESGSLYFGANQEFCATNIQQTIHAEQSAISHAWMRGERKLTDVTVNYTPCGHCRQFMNELNSAETLHIHLPHSQNNLLHKYLPDSFGPKDLDITCRLFDEHHNGLNYRTEDPIILAALNAANQAHAPYSKSYSGVAIQLQDQQIFSGRYAENAAFNPTLPALQVALNYLLLSGNEVENIQRVVMVEQPLNLSYQKMAEELLAYLGEVKLEYILLP
ncbi:cytidine deaminase [Avibacterium gallinarum]|uniref:Cytidine deaminase n=1 Tax=Avibacterium gallinarum TaxID=755 RepID=A0A379AVH1_AVIGA|nr:cytidine deaminase [Avibacterium gallinarum]POY45000.1 cytidine deaminase [Avibacterium gallinarum]TDP28881.1 cytidine deaminase [Avibacterium gallinarum]SUB26336.1 cytidine deaminase [Avibacterium gallinarum]